MVSWLAHNCVVDPVSSISLKPSPTVGRLDSRAVVEAILSLNYSDAKNRGGRKSTLHYLRENAKTNHPLRTYSPVRERLM